jgi:hypothetical protein
MHILQASRANALLDSLGLAAIRATKVDLFIEGRISGPDGGGTAETWAVFGAAHVKSSIAERIQDDVPASVAFQQRGLLSIALTMDAKSFPPPHGDCVNYGELGGRNPGDRREPQKRGYIERLASSMACFHSICGRHPALLRLGRASVSMLCRSTIPRQIN